MKKKLAARKCKFQQEVDKIADQYGVTSSSKFDVSKVFRQD